MSTKQISVKKLNDNMQNLYNKSSGILSEVNSALELSDSALSNIAKEYVSSLKKAQ